MLEVIPWSRIIGIPKKNARTGNAAGTVRCVNHELFSGRILNRRLTFLSARIEGHYSVSRATGWY
jgi:hypothetical protein